MLRGEFDAAGVADPVALQAEYEGTLADVVQRLGLDTVTERSGLAQETVATVADGEASALTLADAAAILATDDERPPADVIEAEARDVLLLGMTTAVVDVDTLASAMDGALEPKELQQKVEGRQPMTLAEYATIHHALGEHAD